MKIVVVGPGAMGCLFAGLLAESELYDVWLLDKNEIRAKEISDYGITIEGIGGKRTIENLHVVSNSALIRYADLIIISVKSYDTLKATDSIKQIIRDNTIVITLQNGLNNVETISEIIGKEKVIAGITSLGATMLDVGHIRHAGVGDTVIGEIDGTISKRIESVAEIFRNANIQIKITDNIYGSIWGKLIINASINPITAITRLSNGELLEHEYTRNLLRLSAEESANVALASNILLPYDDPVFAVESTCRVTHLNVSSMLQDVLKGKKTEIDAINGEIVKEGKKNGIKTPINESLTYLIKGIESSFRVDN
ncbi:TPA: 2-dehydropantoate 2-reductase [bacterium]|nr:2-dehydropantoate 2-reductase [bacterium]